MFLRPPLKSVLDSRLVQPVVSGNVVDAGFPVFRNALDKFYKYSPYFTPSGMLFYGDDAGLRDDFVRATVLRDTRNATWIRFYDVVVRNGSRIPRKSRWSNIVDLPAYDSLDGFCEDVEDYRNCLFSQYVQRPAVHKPFELFVVQDLPEGVSTTFLELPVFREGHVGVFIIAPYANIFPPELLESLDVCFFLGEENIRFASDVFPMREHAGELIKEATVGVMSTRTDEDFLKVLARRQISHTEYGREYANAVKEDKRKFLEFLESLPDGSDNV